LIKIYQSFFYNRLPNKKTNKSSLYKLRRISCDWYD